LVDLIILLHVQHKMRVIPNDGFGRMVKESLLPLW